MTVDLQPGTEAATDQSPAASVTPQIPIDGLTDWQAEFLEGTTGSCEALEASDESAAGLRLTVSGAGDVFLRPTASVTIPGSARTIGLWVCLPAPYDQEHQPELVALLAGGRELSLGKLDFAGWHLVTRALPQPVAGFLAGLFVRGLFIRESDELVFCGLGFDTTSPGALEIVGMAQTDGESMEPQASEEVTNTIQKDGISFIFEARSLTAVVRYIYTPIEGNLSDIEVEINKAEPIKVSEAGGVTVVMEGKDWSADDEEVQRHFVSCEQVGEWIEARWRWKRGDELADFLYRIGIRGKTLVVKIEGGNGKATGVDLGYVSGAAHPRLIEIPYLNLGDTSPRILSTAGMFISSLIDWCASDASALYGPAPDDNETTRLNGGCRYVPTSDGSRRQLRERWLLTVARQVEEVMPQVQTSPSVQTSPQVQTSPSVGNRAALRDLVWYRVPALQPSEEAYVESYEQLRSFRQLGMTDLLLLHTDDTWRDCEGGPALSLDGAEAKGGEGALEEYLDAVGDLGYPYALFATYRDISPLDPAWGPDMAALQPGGGPAPSAPGRYLLKPTRASGIAADHIRAMADKYGNTFTFLGHHAAEPPWTRLDCDKRLADPASFRATLACERALMAALSRTSGSDLAGGNGQPAETTPEDREAEGAAALPIIIGEGGSHWLYAGLLPAFLAPWRCAAPARQPLLVDFALQVLHPVQVNGGVGDPAAFHDGDLPESERHSRSPALDRYLAATAAFGHAALIPDPDEWGLAAAAKTYFMFRALQPHYLEADVQSIAYHHEGNYVHLTEALISGAYERSQVRVVYGNGLHVYVNGGQSETWTVEWQDAAYALPPGSFLAHSTDGLLVYSADAGAGRIDLAQCDEYVYCDARDTRVDLGAVQHDGALLVRQENWEIDLYPLEDCHHIEVDPARFWPDRRLPPLRVLAHRGDEAEVVSANVTDKTVTIRPDEDHYRYTITLPEWMVEPGK